MKFNTKTVCLSILLVSCAVAEAAQNVHVPDAVIKPKFRLSEKKECSYNSLKPSETKFIDNVDKNNNSYALQMLNDKIISINDCFQDDLLKFYTKNGKLEKLKFLIENGADPTFVKMNHELLIIAIQNGYLNIVKYFVDELGMDVDCKSKKGFTPLEFAVANGHSPIIEYLFEKGARFEPILGRGGEFLLFHANQKSNRIISLHELENFSNIIKLVLSKMESETEAEDTLKDLIGNKKRTEERLGERDSVTKRTSSLDLYFLELLRNIKKFPKTAANVIKEGPVDLNASYQNSLLTMMVIEGNLDAVKFLISQGENPTFVLRNCSQTSLITLAAIEQQEGILDYLLNDLRFSIDHRYESSNTALMEAILKGNFEAAEFLVNKGAKISPMDSEGRNAISLAKSNNKCTEEFIKKLENMKEMEASFNDTQINLTNKILRGQHKEFSENVTEYNSLQKVVKNSAIKKAIQILGVHKVKQFYDEILKKYSSNNGCVEFLKEIRALVNEYIQNHPWEGFPIKNEPVVAQSKKRNFLSFHRN